MVRELWNEADRNGNTGSTHKDVTVNGIHVDEWYDIIVTRTNEIIHS